MVAEVIDCLQEGIRYYNPSTCTLANDLQSIGWAGIYLLAKADQELTGAGDPAEKYLPPRRKPSEFTPVFITINGAIFM